MTNTVNNIGITEHTLPIEIGETTTFGGEIEIASIGITSGELGIGFILFDTNGTFAICTSVSADDNNNVLYTFTTKSLSSEKYIQNTLSKNY